MSPLSFWPLFPVDVHHFVGAFLCTVGHPKLFTCRTVGHVGLEEYATSNAHICCVQCRVVLSGMAHVGLVGAVSIFHHALCSFNSTVGDVEPVLWTAVGVEFSALIVDSTEDSLCLVHLCEGLRVACSECVELSEHESTFFSTVAHPWLKVGLVGVSREEHLVIQTAKIHWVTTTCARNDILHHVCAFLCSVGHPEFLSVFLVNGCEESLVAFFRRTGNNHVLLLVLLTLRTDVSGYVRWEKVDNLALILLSVQAACYHEQSCHE